MTAFKWSDEDIQKLLSCTEDSEFMNAFPGKSIESLKRARRRFRQASLALDASDQPVALKQPVVLKELDAPYPESPKGWQAGVELEGNGGTICSGPTDKAVTDWDELLKVWGLDSDIFEVVEPVTFKAWDASAKDAKGDIQSKRMYSYKARIQKISELEAEFAENFDFSAWKSELLSGVTTPEKLEDPNPSTYVICVADPQIGKPGTKDALAAWKSGILNHLAKVEAIRRLETVERILVAFMGDEHEGVAGFYANQQYEIEMGLSKQLETDFDMRAWTIKTVARLGLPVSVVSVISNHGEFTRQNGKVITSSGDNSSTMVARLVKKLFDGTDYDIEWNIAGEDPDVVLTVSGTKMLFSHGHTAMGSGKSSEFRAKNAYEKQILARTEELGDVTLFVTAHYHHHSLVEHQGRTFLQCPALEAEKASQWFFQKYGVWSKPGMLGFLVGSRFGDRGWASLDVM